jgi:hypothetical protein
VPAVLITTAVIDPDDRDPLTDYLTEDQLRDLGGDPDSIHLLAPHATELRALDGSRCWPLTAFDVLVLQAGELA